MSVRPARDPGRDLQRLRGVARLLDDWIAIPGTRFRVGLDAALGLLPGAGDVVGGAVSTWAIVLAARLGAPPAVLFRMLANVLVDTVVGAVPLLGDLFDIGWKSNRRNVQLVERYAADPQRVGRASKLVVAAILVGVLALAVAGGILAMKVVAWVLSAF